jgi:diguanylate cyclase (GGDEF)-like protein
MHKEKLTYRDLLRKLLAGNTLTAEERWFARSLLAKADSPETASGLRDLLEMVADRGALLRLNRRPEDPENLQRYLDPQTSDKWAIALPGSRPAPDPQRATVQPAAPASAPPPATRAIEKPVAKPAVREEPVQVVHTEARVAQRFLDPESGEPLRSLFGTIAPCKSPEDLAESLEPIREQIVLRTSATDVRFHLLADDGIGMEPIPSRSEQPLPHHELGNDMREKVLGDRHILHVRDLARVEAPPETHSTGALVSLPLASGERVTGIMEVLRAEPDPFSQEELDFFALAAQVIAGLVVRAEFLEKLIFLDKLTGLYNRAYFDDQIEREIERANRMGTSMALLMADLDHFKRINDSYGHQAGDRALAHLAGIIKRNIRQIDIAARYGGEEFAILLPSINRARAVRTAERLRRVVADADFGEITPSLEGTKLSISIGLALYPDDAATAKQLIDRADRVALYAAKNRGRNRVVAWATAREGVEPLKTQPS